jgi:hypothetical protein
MTQRFQHAERPRVVRIRGREVILDRAVAEAFGVETREVNQAVARNTHKFGDEHVFQLTQEELENLTSQAVIPKPGRGGSRTLPWVFSMKGVARLATVIDSPQALGATDLILDVFIEVWRQVSQGASAIAVSNPSRLLPGTNRTALDRLRKKLIGALDELLDTVINSKTNATVREELEETTVTALEHLKERMRTRGLENDRLTAETLLILEQVRDLRERREEELKRTRAKTESVVLDNLNKKIGLVERMLQTVGKLEPNALVALYGGLSPAALPPAVLPGPRKNKHD